ncbi:MAG: HEAT repeat domain-containing protein [Deltaproteobacteria bacterium]|nr:HEAT repeat domain-containing protein [Deltaproteobacteria bacterium]
MRRKTTIFGCTAVMAMLAFATVACKDEAVLEGRPVSEWVSLLRHSDWSMQEKASDALVRMGPVTLPHLQKAMTTKDPTLRRWAAVTLGRLGPKAKPAVPKLLNRIAREEVPNIRAAIVEALARIDIKDPKVIAELEKRAKRDVDGTVKSTAERALAKGKEDPKPKSKIKAGGQDLKNWLLRDEVAKVIEGKSPAASFAIIAEVAREKRRAAIVWPGVDAEGKILGDEVLAFIFEKKGDKFKFIEKVGPLRGSEAAGKLAEVLGGADGQHVVRPCGVAKEELAAHLATQGAAFAKALEDKKPADAMAAFEQLSKAFSFTRVAYDDSVIKMLRDGFFAQAWILDLKAEGNQVPMNIKLADKEMTGMLILRPCGVGFVIGELKEQKAAAPKSDPVP